MLTCLRTGCIVAGQMGPFPMIGQMLGHHRILEKLWWQGCPLQTRGHPAELRQSREGGWCMLLGER